MTSSMIDISESTLTLDFNISLVPINKNSNSRNTLKQTQLLVDTREGKATKIISPDCIFIPSYNNNVGLVP